jgi:hypothetical protein
LKKADLEEKRLKNKALALEIALKERELERI